MKTLHNYFFSIQLYFKSYILSFFKIALFGAILCTSFHTAEAQIDPFDINQNSIADSSEAEVVVESNVTLPAGEYFFNDLTLRNGAVLSAESNPLSADAFKGVKIHVVNLRVSSTSLIEANGKGYGYVPGPGTSPFDYVGASYGGVGLNNTATSTYGSALTPLDLGSAGYYNGGGALWIVASHDVINDGVISANGQSSGSGGSIYITTSHIGGEGTFEANGGGLFASGYFKGPGGGGRIALHYGSNTFTGEASAKGGCGSYDGWSFTCASDGTVGFIDTTNNNIHINSSWRFQQIDSPMNFNNIFLTNTSKVIIENNVILTAGQIVVDQNSSLSFVGSSTLRAPIFTIDGGSTVTLSGEERVVSDTMLIKGNSILTVIPEKVLAISVPHLTISNGSSVVADGKGYAFGPGTPGPGFELAGASYGGVGLSNTASSTYGSEREPVDFGSGGGGSSTRGGGAIRLTITNTLSNDGVISAHGQKVSSGGSVYVIAKNIVGSGIFGANGGNNYCPNVCIGSGGGGRVAVYYETSSFGGEVSAHAGLYCYYGCNPAGENGTVVFEQKQTTPLCTENCYSNVLFLPGLEASRLYKIRSVTCQINCEDQLWEPNIPSDVEDLYMNLNGKSINQSIYTKDVIDKTNIVPGVGISVYENIILDLDNLVATGKINSWKPYAYDWRQSIDDIVENGTHYKDGKVSLVDTLQSLVDTSQNGKVTIIAHSNGGLVAKALIKKLELMKASGQGDLVDHIDILILVASPQLGTPSAVSALLNGYEQSLGTKFFKVMTEVEARKLAQNMPSAYGLLPSSAYFNQLNIGSIAIFASTSDPIFKDTYGSGIDSYQELHNFILGQEGRSQPASEDLISPIKGNGILLSVAESLHASLDTMTIPSTIKVITVGGWGKATIAGIRYTGTDIEPITTIRGDKTVVMESSMYGSGTKYWLDLSDSKLNHSNIFEDPQLLSFIDKIILKEDGNILSTTEPVQVGNRLHLSVHSPVSIGLYDFQGNFTGKVCQDNGVCDIQENIPGSTYFEFGEGKYVDTKEGSMQKAVLQGTGSGTFTFISEKITSTGQTTTSIFTDIPVTTQTQGEVVINTITQVPELRLDVTGDGTVDFTLAPTEDFDPVVFLQIMKKTVESFDIKQSRKATLSKRIDGIIKSIQKGKIHKAQLKADKFKNALTVKTSKPLPKKPKPHRLTNADAEVLIGMLETLLGNLEK